MRLKAKKERKERSINYITVENEGIKKRGKRNINCLIIERITLRKERKKGMSYNRELHP